jgi:hypothetical protein
MVRNNSNFSDNNISIDEERGIGIGTLNINNEKTSNDKLLDIRIGR